MDLRSKKNVFVAILLLLLPMWVGSAEEEISEDAAADTRVLIDVSGSMKENDPKNLRQPALRLLVGLLPKESRAGVWTFGQYVNAEIPLGKVDSGWRDRARASASKIHSRGLYTDIEEALRLSTEDWKMNNGRYSRHVVLLTDGVVDISKSSLTNARSRKRIMNDIMPRLKNLGVKVHTIALSQSADHHLLKKMSANTDGWYEQVDDADRLKRIFLRMFEKVSKPDTVPLNDNKFRLDKSVKEATLLVFNSANKEPTKVKTPSGASFSSDNPPEGVSWHRDDGYDLMTITKPEEGEWQIMADIDPDNRVIVVTDLKMVTSSLPNRVLQGELNNIKVMFKDQGKKITEKEFLDVVDVKSVHRDGEGASEPRPVLDDGKDGDKDAGDGIFTLSFGKDIGKGQIEVILTAEGKTFVREKRFTTESIPAVSVDKFEGERGGRAGLMATVIPEPNLVDGQSLEVEAQLTPEQGEPVAVMFLPGPDGMSRESWIDKTELKGTWNLDISFKAKSVSGSKLEMDLASIPIEGSQPAVAVEPPKAEPEPEPVVEAKPEPVAETEPEQKPEPEAEPEPEVAEEEESGLGNIILFIVINLLIIGGGAGAFWYFRKRRGSIYSELADDEDMLDEVESAEVEAEEAAPEVEETEEPAENPVEEEPQQSEEEAVAEEEPEEEKIKPDEGMDDLSDLDPQEDEAK
jgi:uncharacterized protein (TIGR03503 family)